ncbi:kinesin-like protein KIF19 isoform X2 [Lepeophtheirus salmonis]|uniref:kinesin-like protein KIF19 isoform X2 n=1 Tax=Lepeophtheirus salmonis TaxID=72036 RepID=UPI001AE3F33B|nr:kinesin-like protein KIF19 isoform X1 [Lepeophtheirus salmonis]
MSGKKEDNRKLLVAVRIRPMRNEERAKNYKITCEKFDKDTIALYEKPKNSNNALGENRSSTRRYIYDYVFGSDSTQGEVYAQTVKPLVEYVLKGYTATAFAYGATGGGKTYTMVGNDQNPGCMVRAMDDLFNTLQKEKNLAYKVSMSYLEIYNENIRDLLQPKSDRLELRDDHKGNQPHVIGLSEIFTESTEEVMKLLGKGNKQRTEKATAANKYSSRSHAILIVNVKQTVKLPEGEVSGAQRSKYGKLYMIDLAGSEKASNTKNEGERLREGAHINQALLALSNCINALAENKKKFVNFRDSKLTRLLKESLSGNCFTVMIAHVSPCDKHREETKNTLVYADRAKTITNKVRRNVLDVSYHVSQYQDLISELRSEIGRLKEKIDSTEAEEEGLRSLSPKINMGEEHSNSELKEIREAMVQNFKEQMQMRHKLLEIDNHLLCLTMEFEKQHIIINDWSRSDRDLRQSPKLKLRRGGGRRQFRGRKKRHEDYESGIEDMDTMIKYGLDQESEEYEDDYEEEVEPGEMTERESDESEEVKNAWSELQMIQKEQDRYNGTRLDLEHDLLQMKKIQSQLEEELPKRITTDEEKEILSLLCRVHELEIEKIEIQREGYMKEYEVRKRDILILKYDKQRNLCDEIIARQKQMIEGSSVSMPPELIGMYSLYQQELENRQNDGSEQEYITDLNALFRSPSTLSLHDPHENKSEKRKSAMSSSSSCQSVLPPIGYKLDHVGQDKLFQKSERPMDHFVGHYSDDSLSVSSSRPSSELGIHDYESGVPLLPPISSSMYRSHSISEDIHRTPSTSYRSRGLIYHHSRLPSPRNLLTRNSIRSSRPTVMSSPEYSSRKSRSSRQPKSRKNETKRNRHKSKTRYTDPLSNYEVPMLRY